MRKPRERQCRPSQALRRQMMLRAIRPMRCSQQFELQLIADPCRRREQIGAPLELRPGKTKLCRSSLEAPADHPRIGTRSRHALAELRIVDLAVAGRADERE